MKTIPLQEAVGMIPDGASLMIGGFMGCGTPEPLMDELVRQGKRDLTVIANDTAMPGVGIGKLVRAKLVRKLIASHIGLNPETQQQMIAGELEVELVPQGTLIERIRAGGAGLGGVLTPTGVGTVVEEGKQKISLDGRDYLLETAAARRLCAGSRVHLRLPRQSRLRAHGAQLQPGDRHGRRYGHRPGGAHRAGRRHRPGPRGDPRPAGRLRHRKGMNPWMHRTIIAKRIALELRDGMLVNLGIGIPTLVANFVPASHARVLPVGERPDRHRPGSRAGHGASVSHRRGRPAGHGAAGRVHLRQRDYPSR